MILLWSHLVSYVKPILWDSPLKPVYNLYKPANIIRFLLCVWLRLMHLK